MKVWKPGFIIIKWSPESVMMSNTWFIQPGHFLVLSCVQLNPVQYLVTLLDENGRKISVRFTGTEMYGSSYEIVHEPGEEKE